MKITPAAGPVVPQAPTPQVDKRAAAIAAFEAASKPAQAIHQPQQEYVVANANQISPEEASTVMPKSEQLLDKQANSEDTVKPEVEEPKAEEQPQKDPEVVKQFAEIARQERILRAKAQKQQQELATQKAALDAQKAALDARSKEIEQGYIPRERLKADLLGTLEAEGYSYDDITQKVLNPLPKNPLVDAEIKALRDELKALKGNLDESRTQAEQREQQQYQQAINQLKLDTEKLVRNNAEEFEAIAKTGAVQDVVDLIEQVYKKDGIIMTVQEAAQEVENYLVEESLSTVSRIEKIKKRLATASTSTVAAKPVTEVTQAKPEETPAQMKTLTNATSSTRKLSGRERALLAFEGKLK